MRWYANNIATEGRLELHGLECSLNHWWPTPSDGTCHRRFNYYNATMCKNIGSCMCEVEICGLTHKYSCGNCLREMASKRHANIPDARKFRTANEIIFTKFRVFEFLAGRKFHRGKPAGICSYGPRTTHPPTYNPPPIGTIRVPPTHRGLKWG